MIMMIITVQWQPLFCARQWAFIPTLADKYNVRERTCVRARVCTRIATQLRWRRTRSRAARVFCASIPPTRIPPRGASRRRHTHTQTQTHTGGCGGGGRENRLNVGRSTRVSVVEYINTALATVSDCQARLSPA